MRPFSWFGFLLFVLCSLPETTGQSNLICSHQPIVAVAGDDVVLPCRLDPPISASSRTVEWTRPGSDPEYIHVHQEGRLVHHSQNPLYNYRTALFVDQLINGNVSLKLFRVKASDAGKYKCFLPSLWKEAFIQLVVEDFFMAPSSCTPCIAVSVVFGFLFVLAVALLVWRWRQNKTEINTHLKTNNEEEAKKTTDFNDTTQQSLMEADRRREQLMIERQKIEEELLKKEEEQKDMTQVIDTLTELEKELDEQKEKLSVQVKEVEKRVEENEKKVKSVERDEKEKEGDKTATKGQGLKELKDLITENNWNLEERKNELYRVNLNLDKLSKKTIDDCQRFKERKKKVENHMEQMKKQLEEIQRELQPERGRRREDNMTKQSLNMTS